MTGLNLSQYRIDAELGRGGMGIVYKATDTKLNRTVALKVLPVGLAADSQASARFLREAQAAGKLSHPNLVRVHAIGEHRGAPYYVMDLVEGTSLQDRLRAGPLPAEEAIEIGRAHV